MPCKEDRRTESGLGFCEVETDRCWGWGAKTDFALLEEDAQTGLSSFHVLNKSASLTQGPVTKRPARAAARRGKKEKRNLLCVRIAFGFYRSSAGPGARASLAPAESATTSLIHLSGFEESLPFS